MQGRRKTSYGGPSLRSEPAMNDVKERQCGLQFNQHWARNGSRVLTVTRASGIF